MGYSPSQTAFDLLSRNASAADALKDWNAGVYTRLYLVDYYSGEVGFGGSQLNGKPVPPCGYPRKTVPRL